MNHFTSENIMKNKEIYDIWDVSDDEEAPEILYFIDKRSFNDC